MKYEQPLKSQTGNLDEPILLDILKAAFRHEGIEFESATFQRWQVVDDTIIPIPIGTLSSLFRELRDGNYHLAISQAKVSITRKEHFEIPWICVEIAYKDGQWTVPTIFHDEEFYLPADEQTTQTLDARLRILRDNIRIALEWLAQIMSMAEAIRRLFDRG